MCPVTNGQRRGKNGMTHWKSRQALWTDQVRFYQRGGFNDICEWRKCESFMNVPRFFVILIKCMTPWASNAARLARTPQVAAVSAYQCISSFLIPRFNGIRLLKNIHNLSIVKTVWMLYMQIRQNISFAMYKTVHYSWIFAAKYRLTDKTQPLLTWFLQ